VFRIYKDGVNNKMKGRKSNGVDATFSGLERFLNKYALYLSINIGGNYYIFSSKII
jgi:hypothetical protein